MAGVTVASSRTAGINIGLGNNFVLHTEGLYRKSGDYAVPRYQKEEGRLKRLPDSHADSQTGSIGLSWVGEKGFIGAAYSDRRDRYGLPAHSHLYDDCHADIIWQKSLINKRYLQLYPHLLTEEDIVATVEYLVRLHAGDTTMTAPGGEGSIARRRRELQHAPDPAAGDGSPLRRGVAGRRRGG